MGSIPSGGEHLKLSLCNCWNRVKQLTYTSVQRSYFCKMQSENFITKGISIQSLYQEIDNIKG